MSKKIWWIAVLLTTVTLLLPVSSVFAAESATAGFTTWPAKSTSDVKKAWTITFDGALTSSTINNNTVYVLNSKQAKVGTTVKLSTDGLTATVTPTLAYAAGDYSLYITNSKTSLKGKKLAEQVIVPFTVEATTSGSGSGSASASLKYILDVESVINSYVTELNVQTAPDVYTVNVNKMKMQYMGDNMFSTGIFGVSEGSTVLIEAYDQNGKLLQSYNYIAE